MRVNLLVNLRATSNSDIICFLLQNVDVRFIEYMPFDGNKWNYKKMMPYQDMLDVIKGRFPDFTRLTDHPTDTSKVTQSLKDF